MSKRKKHNIADFISFADVWKFHIIPFVAPVRVFRDQDVHHQVAEFVHIGYACHTLYNYWCDSEEYRLVRALALMIRCQLEHPLPSVQFMKSLTNQRIHCLLYGADSAVIDLESDFWFWFNTHTFGTDFTERFCSFLPLLSWQHNHLFEYQNQSSELQEMGRMLESIADLQQKSFTAIIEAKPLIHQYHKYLNRSYCFDILIEILDHPDIDQRYKEVTDTLLLLFARIHSEIYGLQYFRKSMLLWSDEEFMRKLLKTTPIMITYAPDSMIEDRAIALDCVKRDNQVFVKLWSFRDDDEIAFHGIRELRSSIYDACIFLRRKPLQFSHVSPRLAENKAFVLKALEYSNVWYWIPQSMQQDEDVILAASKYKK